MRTIAALVATSALAASLGMAAPAGADDARVVPSPGFAYVRIADAPSDEGGNGSAAARLSSGSATASATFTPPPNDDFVFHYGADIGASKRAAFEAAGGLWSSVLEVEVPIDVGVRLESFSDPGILGGAAPTDLLANHASLPRSDTWYVSALANQFLTVDADPGRVEIDVVISADYDFHEDVGTDAPADRVSLMTLALHELGHGLGHTTLARHLPDGTGTIRYEGFPLAYDLQVTDASRVPLVDLTPAALGKAMTERMLWRGQEAIRADGGLVPEIYAPELFQPGSSVSHLDERTYTTDLMTPFIAGGETHRSVPALTRAMMADFGWGVEADTSAEAFVTAASRDFIERFPTPTELDRISARLASGAVTRQDVARSYGFSDEWVGAVVDGYYLTTLGRVADAGGKQHWSDRLRSGVSSAEVVASFFASTEYFSNAGATNRSWVQALYRDILGRDPDASGLGSWTASADAGTPRSVIAASIHQAQESRAKRVTELYQRLLGRDPDPGGLAAWTDVLRNGRDIELAVRLASSPEYEDRAVRRFG